MRNRQKIQHIREMAGAAVPELTGAEIEFLKARNYTEGNPLVVLKPTDADRQLIRGIGQKIPDIKVI